MNSQVSNQLVRGCITTLLAAVDSGQLRSTHPASLLELLALLQCMWWGQLHLLLKGCVAVAAAAQRGDMLRKMRGHLCPGGLAFVMLPLRCLDSSPFMTWQHFEKVLAALGLQVSQSNRFNPVPASYRRSVCR